MRTIGYVRVSTEEQQDSGLSLEAQRFSIEQATKTRDLPAPLLLISEPAAISASVPLDQRPGWREAESALATGDESTVLIVSRLDRLTRDTFDGLGLMRTWVFPPRVSGRTRPPARTFLSLSELVDTRTAAGRFTVTMQLAMATYERELVGERTSAALKQIQRSGRSIGRVPYGYRRKNGVMTAVPEELAIAEQVKAWAAAGASPASIVAELNARAVPPPAAIKGSAPGWTEKRVRTVLSAGA